MVSRFQVFPLERREGRIQSQFGHAQDAVHGRPDLMAHGCQESAFRLAGLGGQVPGGHQVALVGDHGGDVPEAEYTAYDMAPQILGQGLVFQHPAIPQLQCAAGGGFRVGQQGFLPERVLLGPRQAGLQCGKDRGVIPFRHQALGNAPQAGELMVEVDDAAFRADHQNTVGGGFQRRPQLGGGPGQFFLDLVALGHFPAMDHDIVPALPRTQIGTFLDVQHGAVFTPIAGLHPLGGGELAGGRLIPIGLIHQFGFQVPYIPPRQVPLAVAQGRPGPGVGEHHPQRGRLHHQENVAEAIGHQTGEAGRRPVAGRGAGRLRREDHWLPRRSSR